MRIFTTLIVGVFAAIAVFIAAFPTADACDPGLQFEGEIVEDDTPDCIILYSFGSQGGGQPMRVWNECGETLELEAIECVGCDSSLLVEPAAPEDINEEDDNNYSDPFWSPSHKDRPAEATLTIKSGDESELETNQPYTSHYAWSLQESGTAGDIKLEVEYHGDNSDHCQDWDGGPDDGSCSAAGSFQPTHAPGLIALLFGVFLYARRSHQ